MKTRDLRGFTILEVLMAAVLLGIGMTALLGLQGTIIQSNKLVKDKQVGLSIAQAVAEDLKAEAAGWSVDQPVIPLVSDYGDSFGWYEANSLPMDSSLDRIGTYSGTGAAPNYRYCVEVRASHPTLAPVSEGGQRAAASTQVVVGQVRVAWRNDGVWAADCTAIQAAAYPSGNVDPDIHVVYYPFTVVRQ